MHPVPAGGGCRPDGVTMFYFYIILDDGQEVRWPGLSATAAEAMYNATRRSPPDNVREYGWKELAQRTECPL